MMNLTVPIGSANLTGIGKQSFDDVCLSPAEVRDGNPVRVSLLKGGGRAPRESTQWRIHRAAATC